MFNQINRVIPKFLRFTKNAPIKAKSVPQFDEKLMCYITGKPRNKDYCDCRDKCMAETEPLDSLHERGIFPPFCSLYLASSAQSQN